MKMIDPITLLKWVKRYEYNETDDGIGTCRATIKVRDEEENLKDTFDILKDLDLTKKYIMCCLIEKVGYPCEDYADDFDNEYSGFGFTCEWDEDEGGIVFEASFRV